jgi:hypothetical protein
MKAEGLTGIVIHRIGHRVLSSDQAGYGEWEMEMPSNRLFLRMDGWGKSNYVTIYNINGGKVKYIYGRKLLFCGIIGVTHP